jgi:TonB family protein
MSNPRSTARLLSLSGMILAMACGDGGDGKSLSSRLRFSNSPDVLPQMKNSELPFRYPPDLYAQRVQGNVVLRMQIDREGRVLSSSVEESSEITALDSAAVKGSHDLLFEPARRGNDSVPVTILFPVYFRIPGAPALPGDTILEQSKEPR